MRGKVKFFDPEKGVGVIIKDNGSTLNFVINDWHGNGDPKSGDSVQFTESGGKAKEIKKMG